MHRLTGAFLCLLLAAPLAGIGGLAAWSVGRTIWDAQRSQDWVRVRTDVIAGQPGAKPGAPDSGHFAYVLDGKRYEGRRLAHGALGGPDDIDAWRAERAEALRTAHAAGRSPSVWVNPDDPAESVLDRGIRWHETILLGMLAIGFGGAGVGALVAAASIAGGVPGRHVPNAATGAMFLWIFATIWNGMSYGVGWIALADIFETQEWVGLFVLLFPFVGVFLLWGAVTATVGAIRAKCAGSPAGRGRAPVRQAGAFAAQAARAMTDPAPPGPARPTGPASAGLPPWVAKTTREGGDLVIRFSPMRRLALALIVFAIGAVLATLGGVMLARDGSGGMAILLLVAGIGTDFAALALMGGSLVVRVRAGGIDVRRGGLLRQRAWTLRRESVRAIVPTVGYTVNDVPYFAIHAETTTGERVVLGDAIKGAGLAEAYARWLAATAGFPASLVRPAPGTLAAES